MNQPRSAGRRRAPLRQPAGALDGRGPILQQIRGQGEDEVGPVEAKDRLLFPPEGQQGSGPQRGRIERLVDQMLGAVPQRARKGGEQRAERAALETAHEEHPLGRRLRALDRRTELLEGSLPGNGLAPATVGDPLRALGPCGVVEPLQCRLAAATERPTVEGMLEIALELHDPALARAGRQPAASRTLLTDRLVEGRQPGHLILRGDQERDDLVGAMARRAGGSSSRSCRSPKDAQETAPVQTAFRIG